MLRGSARVWCCLVTVAVLAAGPASAQELEPRAFSNVPVGMNFGIAGYGFMAGNVLFDPALPAEDVQADVHSLVVAYVRSIDFFGLSSKVDVIVPAVTGRWRGLYEGVDTTRVANGFGDPRVRLSVNFLGAPALKPQEFASYQPGTIVGMSLQVWVPLGQYDPDRLLNIGSHRWTFRPQVGVSHTMGQWVVEATLAAWFFTRNGDFWGGQTLQQHPFFAGKLHVVRTISRRLWVALAGGIGSGARGIVNGVPRDTRLTAVRVGITGVWEFVPRHSARLNLVTTRRIERGPDFEAFALSYQYRW
jgi:hypothetical protein